MEDVETLNIFVPVFFVGEELSHSQLGEKRNGGVYNDDEDHRRRRRVVVRE